MCLLPGCHQWWFSTFLFFLLLLPDIPLSSRIFSSSLFKYTFMKFYWIRWIITHYYHLFWSSKFPRFGQQGLHQAGSYVLWHIFIILWDLLFFFLWSNKMFQIHLVLFLPWNQQFLQWYLVLFSREQYLKTKITVPGMHLATGRSLLLGLVNEQS